MGGQTGRQADQKTTFYNFNIGAFVSVFLFLMLLDALRLFCKGDFHHI